MFIWLYFSWWYNRFAFILKNVFGQITGVFTGGWRQLRPANSPVVLRIFDLGHGEEIRAPRPLSSGVPVPFWSGNKGLHTHETFRFNEEKISHRRESQTWPLWWLKCPVSDHITSGDDRIIQTKSKRFLSSRFYTLTLIFCSDRLSR